MPTTVQIPDLDDGVHAVLVRRAAAAGVNVPELLRAEITRLVAASSVEEWLQRVADTRRHSGASRSSQRSTNSAARGPMSVVDAHLPHRDDQPPLTAVASSIAARSTAAGTLRPVISSTWPSAWATSSSAPPTTRSPRARTAAASRVGHGE